LAPAILWALSPAGPAHSLSNPFSEDLVYLVGGLRLEFDICDYPKINTRLYRRGEQREYVDLAE
jgi:uncharacterized cupin superfamily protein